MMQPIYKHFASKFLPPWYKLSNEERERLYAEADSSRQAVEGELLVLCDVSWASEEWHFFGTERFPTFEALQTHTRFLSELRWSNYIDSMSFIGSEYQFSRPQGATNISEVLQQDELMREAREELDQSQTTPLSDEELAFIDAAPFSDEDVLGAAPISSPGGPFSRPGSTVITPPGGSFTSGGSTRITPPPGPFSTRGSTVITPPAPSGGATTSTICKSKTVPPNYVIVGETRSFACEIRTEAANAWIIKRPDRRELVCGSSPIPANYRVVSRGYSLSCERGDGSYNAYWIERI